jgi:DNA-binding IclR family transcriptional regulator
MGTECLDMRTVAIYRCSVYSNQRSASWNTVMARHIQSIERAANILTALSAAGRLGVTDLARKVGLEKSTTHRMLTSMIRSRLVRREPNGPKYMLGFGLLELTASCMGELEIRQIALPHLRELRRETGETVSLNVRDGNVRVMTDRLDTSHEIRFMAELGRPLPLHLGAGGKAILAFIPEAEVNDLLKSITLAPRKLRELVRELKDIRRVGWICTIAERVAGAGSIAAPVLAHNGAVVGSICILSPQSRLQSGAINNFGHAVQKTALVISNQLGWVGTALNAEQTVSRRKSREKELELELA